MQQQALLPELFTEHRTDAPEPLPSIQADVHESFFQKVPRGWGEEIFEGFSGIKCKRAIDPDGCHWHWHNAKWTLIIYSYGNSYRNRTRVPDLAFIHHVAGLKEVSITKAGTLLIGKRRIPERKTDH